MIWVIYNIVTGKVLKTQIDEPVSLDKFEASAKTNSIELGQELTFIIEVKDVDLERKQINQLVITQMSEVYLAFQNSERSITELEIRDKEKDRAITDMEIAILELKGGTR